jgi:hypothetical protein
LTGDQVTLDQVGNLEKIIEIVLKQIKSVNLEVPTLGLVIDKIEDLECYEEFNLIVNELSALIFNGIKLGNLKKIS